MIGKEGLVDAPPGAHLQQQRVEQRHIAIGAERHVQVCALSGFGATRVDDDKLRAALGARGLDPLPDHRMAPGGVGAHQQNQICLIQILIAAGDDILAKGAVMGGHGARHAQPRIGVDIGRADESLHQFVGDVVIFGQQLTGNIERNAVRTVRADRIGEALRQEVQRLVPGRAPTGDLGVQQSTIEADRFAQMRALRT